MKRIYALMAVLLASPAVLASTEYYASTTITKVTTYATYNRGDVIIQTQSDTGECADGFWMDKDDIGYESTLSAALSAMHAGSNVAIEGSTTQGWIGTTEGKYCHLFLLKLSK